MTSELGQRQARKVETRRALIDAALELFADPGYDNSTTDDIAARAGVSPRTFFRYFPTKEDVLFFGEYDFIHSFSGVFLAQPDDVGDYEAMVASFMALAPGIERLRRRIRLYQRAIASSARLRGRQQDHHAANAAIVAQAVADRRGLAHPNQGCELLAVVGLAVLQRSLDLWAGRSGRPGMADTMSAQFALLADLVPSAGR